MQRIINGINLCINFQSKKESIEIDVFFYERYYIKMSNSFRLFLDHKYPVEAILHKIILISNLIEKEIKS